MKSVNDVLGLPNDEIEVELIIDSSDTIVPSFYLQSEKCPSNWVYFDFEDNHEVTCDDIVSVEYSPQFNPEHGWTEDVEVTLIKNNVTHLVVGDSSSYDMYMNERGMEGGFIVTVSKELINLINQSMIDFYTKRDS